MKKLTIATPQTQAYSSNHLERYYIPNKDNIYNNNKNVKKQIRRILWHHSIRFSS